MENQEHYDAVKGILGDLLDRASYVDPLSEDSNPKMAIKLTEDELMHFYCTLAEKQENLTEW